MNYNLRPLKATDLFSIANILGKAGLKNFAPVFKEMTQSSNKAPASTDEDATEIGMEFAFAIAGILAENINKVETDLFKFLASVAQVPVNVVQNATPAEFAQLITDVVSMPDFKDFFSLATARLK